jgi:predicted Fe-Mo cluster-binding NifX family protein
MKICLTARGDNLDAQLDPRFGRCEYFIFVDPDTFEFEAVRNPNTDGAGGVGIKSSQLVANKDVQAVITGNVGPNAFQVLSATGIEVITELSGTVREAIERYKKGEVKPAQTPNVETKFGLR